MFYKPTYELFHNEEKSIKILAELDLFNNHIEFQITDETESVIYNSTYFIDEAVDMYFDKLSED